MPKAYENSQKFSGTGAIMNAMRERFRDVLQQVMESEPDTGLGYEILFSLPSPASFSLTAYSFNSASA